MDDIWRTKDDEDSLLSSNKSKARAGSLINSNCDKGRLFSSFATRLWIHIGHHPFSHKLLYDNWLHRCHADQHLPNVGYIPLLVLAEELESFSSLWMNNEKQ